VSERTVPALEPDGIRPIGRQPTPVPAMTERAGSHRTAKLAPPAIQLYTERQREDRMQASLRRKHEAAR